MNSRVNNHINHNISSADLPERKEHAPYSQEYVEKRVRDLTAEVAIYSKVETLLQEKEGFILGKKIDPTSALDDPPTPQAPHTHWQGTVALWRSWIRSFSEVVRTGSDEAIGTMVLGPLFATVHTIGNVFDLPISAFRSKDPTYRFLQIAGEIALGSDNKNDRKKDFDTTLADISEAIKHYEVHKGALIKYYEERFGDFPDPENQKHPRHLVDPHPSFSEDFAPITLSGLTPDQISEHVFEMLELLTSQRESIVAGARVTLPKDSSLEVLFGNELDKVQRAALHEKTEVLSEFLSYLAAVDEEHGHGAELKTLLQNARLPIAPVEEEIQIQKN